MTCIKITNRWTDPSTSKCVLLVFQHVSLRLSLEIPWMYSTSNIKHITWRYHSTCFSILGGIAQRQIR
jgi:hypothetical protein